MHILNPTRSRIWTSILPHPILPHPILPHPTHRYNVNDEHTGGLGLLYCMHLIGVYGSMCILLGLPYVWFTHFWCATATHNPHLHFNRSPYPYP